MLNPQPSFVHLHPIVLESFPGEIALQLFGCIEFVGDDSLGEEKEHGRWPLLRPGPVVELVEEVVESTQGQSQASDRLGREEGTYRGH